MKMKLSRRLIFCMLATTTIIPIIYLSSMGTSMIFVYMTSDTNEYLVYQLGDMVAEDEGISDDEHWVADEDKVDDLEEIQEEIDLLIKEQDQQHDVNVKNDEKASYTKDQSSQFVPTSILSTHKEQEDESIILEGKVTDKEGEKQDETVKENKNKGSSNTSGVNEDYDIKSGLVIITDGPHKKEKNSSNKSMKDNNDKKDKNDGPPKPHPFAGARDTNGQWGYLADVTSVKRRHIELYSNREYSIPTDHAIYTDVCGNCIGEGVETYAGVEVIQKVQVGKEGAFKAEENKLSDKPKPKLLCAIYTYDKNHDLVEAVADSWGWKCDGFLAASTLTNATIGAVDLPHQGEEAYEYLWQKTRSIWGYIYENYVEEYDFFWLGGDDFYMIVENMVNYLATLDDTQELFLGHRIPSPKNKAITVCGGGAGYVLNKVALKRFGKEALPHCFKNIMHPAEDRYMSRCMKDKLGIECRNTMDEKGQQRFLGMDASFVGKYDGKSDSFFQAVYEFWAEESGKFKVGSELVSEQATGFHWLRNQYHVMRYHALFHPEDACSKESQLVQSFKEYFGDNDDAEGHDGEKEGKVSKKEDQDEEELDGGDDEEEDDDQEEQEP